MKSILLLVHRIPYPPDKGDKIRSFHLLRELSRHFNVYLGTFVDDPHDEQYIPHLQPFCADMHVQKITRAGCIFRSLLGLFRGRSVTSSWYRSAAMGEWVNAMTERHEISGVIAFSSGMAQFLPGQERCPLRVMEFVDLDSAKWRQMAEAERFPKSWIYSREARLVLQEEKTTAKRVELSTFVSPEEASLLRKELPHTVEIMSIRNGIDSKFFDPDIHFASPYAADEQALVFTGAMDYWANVEAVKWFVDSIFPRILAQSPQAKFYIVGARPPAAVTRLARTERVEVTGRVEDVRPYLASAQAVVVPLRLARGVQNKVLEGMAMARPIVVTRAAIEGIGDPSDPCLKVADTAEDFASACTALLTAGEGVNGARTLRKYVVENFSWQSNLAPLMQWLEAGEVSPAKPDPV